ncbi:sugar transferase [Verrucomicrobiota bacterium sgz303538]
MIHRRVRGLALLHGSAQIALALMAFWGLFGLQFGVLGLGKIARLYSYSVCSLLLVVAFVLYLVRSSLWNEDVLQFDALRSAQTALRQVMHLSAPVFFYLVAAKDHAISRLFLFSYFPILFFVLYLSNRWLPAILARVCFRGRRQQRTLICGWPEDLARIRPWLQRKTALGMQVFGFISLKAQGEDAHGGPTWDTLANLEPLVVENRINQVILTRTLPPAELSTLATRCEELGSRLFALHDLEEQLGRPISFIRDDGLYFFALREEPLECPMNRIIKRALDIAVALPVVCLILPWTSLLVWLIHRIQSPGPLVFRQTRTGLHNEEFAILKYRTMHVNHGRGAAQATVGDPRIFTLGGWLRKLSIDELPQFINVLRGDMSIVGPRPHMSEHDAMFAKVAQFYRVRALIKPGITGLAQVRGYRGETKTDDDVRGRLASDLHYLENWSPMLDCMIIVRTAWQMVRPPGTAY